MSGRLSEIEERPPALRFPTGNLTSDGATVMRPRARRPTYAVGELTLRCDQKCRACGPRAGEPRPDELDTEEALRLVDDLAALGVGEVTLIGGEAYLPGNNPSCHHRVLELDRQGLRERIEPESAAPDVPFGAGRFRLILEPKPVHGRIRGMAPG
jgi:hypothetical protein